MLNKCTYGFPISYTKQFFSILAIFLFAKCFCTFYKFFFYLVFSLFILVFLLYGLTCTPSELCTMWYIIVSHTLSFYARFLQRINNDFLLFNLLFFDYKGKKKYCRLSQKKMSGYPLSTIIHTKNGIWCRGDKDEGIINFFSLSLLDIVYACNRCFFSSGLHQYH